MRLFLALFLLSACSDMGTVKLGGVDDTGDTSDTSESTDPANVLSVSFEESNREDADGSAVPGDVGYPLGGFAFENVDGVSYHLGNVIPIVYVADQADAASGWHAGHQGNVWAKDYISGCTLTERSDSHTFATAVPDDKGRLFFDDDDDLGLPTVVAGWDAAGSVIVLDVTCDFATSVPGDGEAAFAIDLRDPAGVSAFSTAYMDIVIASTNGDPPAQHVTLTE